MLEGRHRTKIIATVGPASLPLIADLIRSGVNVFRLNFSHGTHAAHAQSIATIRAASQAMDAHVAILADLQGPKIRTGKVIEGGMKLVNGQTLHIVTSECIGQGDTVSTCYTSLPAELVPGNRILLDDGLLELQVVETDGCSRLTTRIVTGGILTSNKGINLPYAKLSTPALTEKDLEDLAFIVTQDVDFVALSFVRSKHDLDDIHAKMLQLGRVLPVISKIEKPEALDDIEAIVQASYGIMVARGDLGVETPPEQVPTIQKLIVQECLRLGRPVIVATQMLDSMIRNPRPTRAEASDVANAVLDGASALMLSGETASGQFPLEAVQMMSRIISDVEHNFLSTLPPNAAYHVHDDADRICGAIVDMALSLNAKAILCLTDSGKTAKAVARFHKPLPILACAPVGKSILRELCLHAGVIPMALSQAALSGADDAMLLKAINTLPGLRQGDLVLVAAALPLGQASGTNSVRMHRIGCTHSPFAN